MAVSYMLLINPDLNWFLFVFSSFEQRLVCVERVRQYLGNKTEKIKKIQSFQQSEKKQQTKQNLESSNDVLNQQFDDKFYNNEIMIEFKNVNMSYTTATNQKFQALKNVCFSIKRGEKVAIVGRTGSGKSSILNSLFRMYEIDSGQILIYGENINSLSLSVLRSNLSVIPQFGFLFSGTLKENLDPNNQFTHEQIEEILKFSKLRIKGKKSSKNNKGNNKDQLNIANNNGALQLNQQLKNQQSDNSYKQYQQLNNNQIEPLVFEQQQQFQEQNVNSISNQKLNLELLIDHSGSNLSNGEKQIINFHRILIRNRHIVCLDEATSNLDEQTDKVLHSELFEFCSKDKTLLVITHRLENIDKFDRIIIMEKGEILEIGNINELKQRGNQFFKKYFQENFE